METSATLGLMFSMESKIRIFEGNQKDGIFSSSKKFYPNNYTEEQIILSIKESRKKLGEKYGFSGLKMFQVRQKMEDNDVYEDNKDVFINDLYMKNEDYFMEKIEADILFIDDHYKGVALAHRMADCPVLIAEDRKKGYSGIVHCGIYHINRGLPKAFLKKMIEKYHSNPKDIYLYIGSHIKKESYIYDTYPKIATNKQIWKDAIKKKDDGYHINLLKAIMNQIELFDIAEIKVSKINTATHKDYASHYAAVHGDNKKLGQNIVGFYYK